MLLFTKKIHEHLLVNLEELSGRFNPRNLKDPRLDVIVQAIEQINEKLKSHRFKSEEDEIYFFRSVLPNILSLHIYYAHVMEWDRLICQGSEKSKYAYYDSIYTKAENFRNVHRDFHDYCRDGKTHLDALYFLRSSPLNKEIVYQPGLMKDPASPPIHCEMLARFMAYAKLENDLHQSITNNQQTTTQTDLKSYPLTWTLPKIFLIELIYSLQKSKAFNDGKADLKTIVTCFERIFQISLGNYTRAFQEILSRKMGYTSFLDQLKKALLDKIDQIENGNSNEGKNP